ncbi:MAG TPA: AI-2E family transporter [Longimicrobium sp.]|nr:AI-2E family transporter [Longimicrobium sp.]
MAEHNTPDHAAARVPADAVAAAPRRTEGITPQHIYRAVGLAFLLALVYRYWDELTQVFLLGYAAAILAVLLNAVRRRLHVKRSWLAAGVGLLVVGGVVALLAWGMPLLIEQARGVIGTGPALEEQITKWEQQIQQKTGMKVNIPDPTKMFQGGSSGGNMMGSAATVLEILFVPLILFFGGLFALANPNERLLTPMLRVVPHGLRLAWYRIFQLLGERLIGWAKGTGMAMIGVGLLSTAALLVIGVPNAIVLGMFNGLVEFIPLFGPWVGGLTAVLIAFLDDPQKALWTAIAALGIQQIEANLITPWAMSRNAEVHPFVTLFGLVLFGSLFGFLGILLAIPLVMLTWTLVQVLWVERAIDTDRDRIAPVVEE